MKPETLQMIDFGSFSNATVDFSPLSLVAIVGENGAGKSTLLTAMTVALFGAKVGNLDGFVRQGADKFTLHFNFEVDGKRYAVKREYRKAQSAELHIVDGDRLRPACEPKVSVVDAMIVGLLGCGYDEFSIAHHIPQGALGAFATLDPANRKAWLMSNLPMGLWGRLEEHARTAVKEMRSVILRLEGERSALAAAPGYDRDADLEEIANLSSGADASRDELNSVLEEIEAGKETNRAARTAASHYNDLSDAYLAAARTYREAEQTMNEIDQQVVGITEKMPVRGTDADVRDIEVQGIELSGAWSEYKEALFEVHASTAAYVQAQEKVDASRAALSDL